MAAVGHQGQDTQDTLSKAADLRPPDWEMTRLSAKPCLWHRRLRHVTTVLVVQAPRGGWWLSQRWEQGRKMALGVAELHLGQLQSERVTTGLEMVGRPCRGRPWGYVGAPGGPG